MLRLEIELPGGLVIRSRMSKEDYARLGLADGRPISFQIRAYRVLSKEGDPLADEVATTHEMPPPLARAFEKPPPPAYFRAGNFCATALRSRTANLGSPSSVGTFTALRSTGGHSARTSRWA